MLLFTEQKISRQQFSSSFSDFITRYTAISSTNIRTQTAEYYGLETDDGLTMNLGVNPLLQFGLEETRKALLENILSDLSVMFLLIQTPLEIRHWIWGMCWYFPAAMRMKARWLV